MASSLYFKPMEFCGSPIAATYNSSVILAFCLPTLIRLQQLGKEQNHYIAHHSGGIKRTATMADKFRGTENIPHLPLCLHSLLAPQTISAFVHDMTAHWVSPSIALPVENFI